MKVRRTLNEYSPQGAIDRFKLSFSYDSETGEITNKAGRMYKATDVKGYRRALYRVFNGIEYRITYHRLCWFLYYGEFVPKGMQIDHIDLNPGNNAIKNLQITTNALNSLKKRVLRISNSTGYKGVSIAKDRNKYGTEYTYYGASINVNKKQRRIGRFKDPVTAAKFYDSANRFYYGMMSKCNFKEVFIKPMSIEDLREYKKHHAYNTSK